jgi:hypothetical protein
LTNSRRDEISSYEYCVALRRATPSTSKNTNANANAKNAIEQAKVMDREGVLRMNGVLTPVLADRLRVHVLEQQRLAKALEGSNPELARSLYGAEQVRKDRCDLQLSLMKEDNANNHVVADVLNALLGTKGTLRGIYEQLRSQWKANCMNWHRSLPIPEVIDKRSIPICPLAKTRHCMSCFSPCKM